MTERPTDADEPRGSDAPWAADSASEEPEPEWAAEIRARRKARGDRLRQIFSTFDEEKEGDS